MDVLNVFINIKLFDIYVLTLIIIILYKLFYFYTSCFYSTSTNLIFILKESMLILIKTEIHKLNIIFNDIIIVDK